MGEGKTEAQVEGVEEGRKCQRWVFKRGVGKGEAAGEKVEVKVIEYFYLSLSPPLSPFGYYCLIPCH